MYLYFIRYGYLRLQTIDPETTYSPSSPKEEKGTESGDVSPVVWEAVKAVPNTGEASLPPDPDIIRPELLRQICWRKRSCRRRRRTFWQRVEVRQGWCGGLGQDGLMEGGSILKRRTTDTALGRRMCTGDDGIKSGRACPCRRLSDGDGTVCHSGVRHGLARRRCCRYLSRQLDMSGGGR